MAKTTGAFRLGTSLQTPSVIPTGLRVLDKYLCPIGGIPRGMITEFYGPTSTWKSGLLYHLLANAQQLNEEPPALIDSEGSFSSWAVSAGVDPARLYLPVRGEDWNSLEDVWRLVQAYIDAGVPMVGIDSLGAMTTNEQMAAFAEGKQDARLGSLARATGNGLKALCAGYSLGKEKHIPLHQSKTAVVIINHVYDRLEDTSKKPVYDRFQAPAGHEMKFLAHLRMFFWTVKHEKGDMESIKQYIRLWVTKTRFSPPLRHADIFIDFKNAAYEDVELIVNLGLAAGVVKKESGSWYSVDGERVNGQNALWEKLSADPDTLNRIFGAEFNGADVLKSPKESPVAVFE